jgi:hypothetical protein
MLCKNRAGNARFFILFSDTSVSWRFTSNRTHESDLPPFSFFAWKVLNIVPRSCTCEFCRRERIDLHRWTGTIAHEVSLVLLAVCLMLSVKKTKDSPSQKERFAQQKRRDNCHRHLQNEIQLKRMPVSNAVDQEWLR